MSHKLAIKIARILRSYGFVAVAVGSEVSTDASDHDVSLVTVDAIMGGV